MSSCLDFFKYFKTLLLLKNRGSFEFTHGPPMQLPLQKVASKNFICLSGFSKNPETFFTPSVILICSSGRIFFK